MPILSLSDLLKSGGSVNLLRYVKRAFLNHWNLLALFAGTGFAVLSGKPEVGLPLVAAAEIAWLGFVGTHPKFQRYIDTTDNTVQQSKNAQVAEQKMRQMFAALPRGAQARFQTLSQQCQELRTISLQFQAASGNTPADQSSADLRLGGLDRLMWLFLKLLYTEYSLNRFFETTTVEQIQKDMKDISSRIQREQDRPAGPQRDRILTTLQDGLQTVQERMKNFEQARDSYELVKAEQQRLESRIRGLAEMGISRGDPATLSDQVDTVAGSIAQTEKTLEDLQFVTGFSAVDEAIPEILPRAQSIQ